MPRASTNLNNWRQHVESTATQSVQCDSLLPVDTDTNRNPLVFNVRPSPGLVIDSKNIRLLFTVNVQKFQNNSWVKLENSDNVSLYNNFGFSAFEDVQFFLGGTLCETSMREYARSSYIRNLLFTTEQEQHSLESSLFFKDNPMYGDLVMMDPEKNPGEQMRSLMIKNKPVTLHSPIYIDILQSGSYLPDNTGFTLRLYPAKTDKCVLQSKTKITTPGNPPVETEDFLKVKVTITRAELHVPLCRLSVPIPKSVTTDYESCKVFNHVTQKGMKSFSCSVNSEILPSKMAIVMLSEKRYDGAPDKSGLVFKHQKVSNITVKSNGRVLPTLAGLNMDPENKNWSEAYSAIFGQLNAINPFLGFTTFDNGNAIYGINLQRGTFPDKKPLRGTCDIDITFQEAPATNLVVLLFCYYNSKYTIDKNGVLSSELNPKL